ncbi:MAG: cysteine--tRNA ligase [Pseudomonadota bacterium]
MNEIRLYNTKTRQKDLLRPGPDGRVGFYLCGPTVYDRAHIGNARSAVVFDVLFRLLRHIHGRDAVTFVRNFTDVDDKIIARAEETGQDIDELTATTAQWYLEDMGAAPQVPGGLGCLAPDVMPRATEYVTDPGKPVDMMRMIETLIAKGHAYEAEGHVLFSVPSWEPYGRFSGRSTDELIAGARVEVAPYKRDPMDFVLWKPSAPDQPGWESPWGRGRPGWHIECSAMSEALLGKHFQIHGGGIDLVFPHHENERAQSCCANDIEDMADIWVHNGFLMVEGEKMSKSLGNFFTARDLIAQGIPGEVIRLALLATHYRQPLDWTAERTAEARGMLEGWERQIRPFREADLLDPALDPDAGVIEALANDLNTPRAIAELHRLAGEAKGATPANPGAVQRLAATLGWLGFGLAEIRGGAAPDEAAAALVQALCEALDAARAEKNYARADAIRDRLSAAGLSVKTGKAGTEAEFTPAFDAAKLQEADG